MAELLTDLELVLAYHLGEGDSQFGRTHGSGHCQHHFPALLHVLVISLCGIYKRRRVEMTEMVRNEL